MPRVINLRKEHPPEDAVYIGRGSKWGNPFRIDVHGTRKQVIEKFEDHLFDSGLYKDLKELKGKDLVCFCSPLACHGDILVRWAAIECD